MSCSFCDRDKIEDRIFYEGHGWTAFLAAPCHTDGHTVLAVAPGGSECPTALNSQTLAGLDLALADVVGLLMKNYNPKDVLIASVRGDMAHVHFHLIPLWEHEEAEWRKQHEYKKGHLLEFLGDLEREGDEAFEERLESQGGDADSVRKAITEELQFQVRKLRALSCYPPSSTGQGC